jgi:hypothetical protein
MRRLFIIVLSFGIIGMLMVGWMALMSETHPYSPGNLVYPLQSIAEQVRIAIEHTPVDRAEYAMEIFDRQASVMGQNAGDHKMDQVAGAVVSALELAEEHIALSPFSQQDELYAELDLRLHRADVVVSSITATPEMTNLLALHQKIDALASVEHTARQPETARLLEGMNIPFLTGEYPHMSINLRGGHTQLDCDTCHSQGKYAQTQYQCNSCHDSPNRVPGSQVAMASDAIPDGILASNPYPNHFQGECRDCHSVESWRAIDFDHAQVSECDSCHKADIPLAEEDAYISDAATQHYAGPCLRCHNDTSSWSTVAFSHQASEACEDCHKSEQPFNHYTGACSGCHKDTQNWEKTAHHTSISTCTNCHGDDIKVASSHYPGKCSYCHLPGDWEEVAFDHSGYTDCTSCHTAPINHNTDQCSRCHNTLSWFEANVAHKDSYNCTACHRSQVPEDHFPGNCSLCHTYENWKAPEYDHGNLTFSPCADCHEQDTPNNHYNYSCERCHVTGSWYNVSFDHINANECLSCHAGDTPAQHYTGLCSSCHEVTSWEEVHFNHTGYNDCIACHETPVAHYQGECTDCHTTLTWLVEYVDHILFSTDCTQCHTAPDDHYLTSCIECHSTTTWVVLYFDHTGYDNCTGCHTAPDGHWPGQCSSCHVTDNWAEIYFDHSTYTNCKACHVAPSDHPRGQCDKCHTTGSWNVLLPTPTPVPTAPPTPTPAPPSSALPTPVLPSD